MKSAIHNFKNLFAILEIRHF